MKSEILTHEMAAVLTENDAMWRAVLARDTRFDGAFVYGVNSTRIFCRPSCPSRRPTPSGVQFFATPTEAKSAGFRACLRCRPETVAPHVAQATRIARLIERDPQHPLEGVAAATRQDPQRARKNFRAATGVSPREWADATRLERLKSELQDGQSVTRAQNEAQYGSARALYERAEPQLGMTYAKGGAGARIRFAIAPCALGALLVARTDKGVCSVKLGGDETELEARLRDEFPAASLERDDAGLRDELEAVLDLLQGQEPHPELPLDIRATAFQWRVWKELTRIPRGQTLSYGQLAAKLGTPNAVRAVAGACARNPVALVHPCHRVVGSDGKLTGYRWGVERKRKLLQLERDGPE